MAATDDDREVRETAAYLKAEADAEGDHHPMSYWLGQARHACAGLAEVAAMGLGKAAPARRSPGAARRRDRPHAAPSAPEAHA